MPIGADSTLVPFAAPVISLNDVAHSARLISIVQLRGHRPFPALVLVCSGHNRNQRPGAAVFVCGLEWAGVPGALCDCAGAGVWPWAGLPPGGRAGQRE